MNSKEVTETARCMKESLDTGNIIELQKQTVTIEDESISMIDTIHDLEDENMQLKKQLAERDKEIEELKAKLETAEYWNKKYDDLQSQKDTQTICKQVCDEIKKVVEYHSEWYEQGYVINMVTEDLLKEIDKIEQAKR